MGNNFPSKEIRVSSSFFLKNNLWDDYSYVTNYQLYFIDENKEVNEIGYIKIGKKELSYKERPFSNGVIEEVSDDYFSLGQDKSYYLSLRKLPNNLGEYFLKYFRDISFNRKIWIENQDLDVLNCSLFRDVTKMDAISYQGLFLSDNNLDYRLTIQKEVPIKFNIDNKIPFKNSNIHAIIGNNGVGKTTFLKDIAIKIVKKEFKCEIISNVNDVEDGIDIDYIEKVLFVSFSAFDNNILDIKNKKRFDYLGLHDGSGGFKSPERLNKEFKDSLENLIKTKKVSYINKVLEPLRNVDYFDEHIDYIIENIGDLSKITMLYSSLSSGHRIVIHTLVLLMDILQQGVVTLFDEPETHLHPPLLGAFLQSLQIICNEYNGLLIFATHSPIILQELLTENILVLRRLDSNVVYESPDIVTYGQNVSKLTRTVFGYQNVGFHQTIRELVDNKTLTKDNINLYNIGSEAKNIAWGTLYGNDDV